MLTTEKCFLLVSVVLTFNGVIADTTTCGVATKGPCGPSNQQCGKPFGQTSPQYHVHSLSCSMNDPNGPVYDPVHGLYHMFYQDHLAEPREGSGTGPVWGHAVCSHRKGHSCMSLAYSIVPHCCKGVGSGPCEHVKILLLG